MPRGSVLEKVDEFCGAYEGTEVPYRGIIQQSYGISLTNQDDPSKTGSAGQKHRRSSGMVITDSANTRRGERLRNQGTKEGKYLVAAIGVW